MPLSVRRRRLWLIGLGGAAILGFAGLGLLHAPPVRSRMLAWIASRLEPAGLVLRADGLEYDLTRLDVRIHRLTLATVSTPADPFLTAEQVHVTLGWSTLVGRVNVRIFEAVHPRVVLRRTAADVRNWPASSGGPSKSQVSPTIDFGRVSVDDLEVAWRDAVTGSSADVSGLSVDLTPRGRETSGPLHLAGPARVRWNTHETAIDALDARLAWNSRDLSVEALRMALAEGRLRVDGRVQSLTGDPRLDLKIASDADLAAIAQWLPLDRGLTGVLHVDAAVTGSPPAVDAVITATGRDIAFADLRGVHIEASGRVAGGSADVTALSARIAGGSLNGQGHAAIDGGSGTLKVNWRDIDVATLLRLGAGRDLQPQPAAAATGSLDVQWDAPGLDAFRVRGETRLTPPARLAVSRGPRLPIEGPIALLVERNRLTLRAEQSVGAPDEGKAPGDIDLRTRAIVDLASDLDARDVLRSTLSGSLQVKAPDLKEVGRLLDRAGITADLPLRGGTADGSFSVAGTLGAPRLDGVLDANEVRYSTLDPATLRGRLSANRIDVVLDEIEARLEESSMRGRVRLNVASQKIDGRFEAALHDLAHLASVVPLPVRVDGALEANGTLSGSLTSPHVAGSITATALAAGNQQIDRFEADVRLLDRAVAVDRLCLVANLLNAVGRPDRPNLTDQTHPTHQTSPTDPGGCQLEAHGQVDLAQRTYRVHAAADQLAVRPVSDRSGNVIAPLTTRVSGTLDGEGSLGNPTGRARLAFAGTRWADIDIGHVDAQLTAAGRRVTGDVRAMDLGFRGNGELGIDADGPIAVNGRWEPGDFAEVSRRFGWTPPFPLSGSTSVAIDVAGARDNLQKLHVSADLDRLNLDADNQHVQLVQPARFEYDGRIARVRDLRLTSGSSTLTIAGALGEQGSSGLSAVLLGSLADFAFIQRFSRSAIPNPQPAMIATGAIDLRLNASGSIDRPVLSGAVRLTDGRVPVTPDHAVTDVLLEAGYSSGILTIDALRAAFQGATLEAAGRIPADLFRDRLPAQLRDMVPSARGPADLTAQLSAVTPRVAAPFADPSTLEQLQGRIDASIALQADRAALDRVNGTVTLTRADLTLSGVSLDQQKPTRLVVRDGRVDVADWEWGRGDNRLVLSGGVQLGGTQTLAVTANTSLDLRLLGAFTRPARPAGRADAQIRIGGTAVDPTVDGFVTFTNGELLLASPRLVVSDLSGTVLLARDTIRREHLGATVNGGETEISGSLRHRSLQPLDGTMALRTRNAALDVSGLRAETDADLTLALEPRGPVISGTVTLARSSYREPLSLTGGLLQALRSSSAFGQPVSRGLDRLRLDIRIVTGDDLLVDNNYAQLAANTDLRLVGTAAQPVPIGLVTLAEGGTIFFGGNRYRLGGQNSIAFANPTTIEPDLDVRAVRNVTAAGEVVEITLALKGTPATLQTTLTSDKGYSESDLASLLVTGRTAADAVAGGYTPGAEELLGYLSGELFGTAARALGVDVIRVERGTPGVRFDAGLVATETDPGARLTFGKNIGRSTQVVFSQSLRQSGGLTWIVSYAPLSQAEIRAVSLDSGDRLYDFRHDVVFGKAGQTTRPRPQPQSRVAGVTISGAGADEKAVREHLHLGAGDRFSFFRWQDDRDRLEAFYHERDHAEARVTTRRSDRGAGGGAEAATTEISYDVKPGPHTTIVVEGFAFPRGVIDLLKTAWTRAVIDEFLIDEVETIVRGELVDRGFVRATVKATLSNAADAKELRVEVDPGPHVSDRRIVFAENHAVSTDRLRETIRDPELARAVWLNPDRVRDALAAFYRSEGYLDASVRLDDVVLDGPVATRTIHVHEGEPLRLRDVRFEGVRALSTAEIANVSALTAGEIFSEPLVDRARRAIVERYRKDGFNNVSVTLRTERIPGRSEVDVSVNLEEGPQQRIREVVTTGRVRTRPELVSRALKLEAGQPLNLADWSNARRRLYETGVFRSVDIEPERIAEPPVSTVPAEEPIRARVALEEYPPLRLRYGLEVQDERSIAGDPSRALAPEATSGGGRTIDVGVASDLTMRNLFGRALSAGVAGRYTRDFRAARTFLTAPSMFGLPITSNLFLSRSREQFGESGTGGGAKFVTDLTDLTLEQRVHPRPNLEVAYRYTFEHNHTFDLHPIPDDPPFDVLASIARLASAVLFDTRNDLVDASRGWFHASDFNYGPTSLGSDLRFVKYLLQQRYYRTAGRFVLAGAARLGLASAFGQSLIPSERFFAGGGNSVRGYDENVLSPRDRFGDTVGGSAMVVLNGEARFPIFKIVRGVGFFDAGRAFDAVKDIALGELSAGTGFGVRVQTPIVLLRFDLGIPLDTTLGPRRGRWFFSVGQAF